MLTLTFMFPKFIQVGLYLGGGGAYIREGAYIRDVNWVSYMGGVYSGGLYTGGALTGFYGM